MPAHKEPRQVQPTSFRLTPEAIALLDKLQKDLGFQSRNDVIELALRALAGWVTPPQENFFDAVRNDPTMKPEDKTYWLAMEEETMRAAGGKDYQR